jgi:DNA-binding transcriptional LysR family regulator
VKASYAQIRAFNAVAIEGSFKKAAAILGVSQPAVTLQIRSLEDAYTVVLFKRHRDNAELTVLGQELFAISNPIKLIETEIDDLLTNESALKSGRLTLAAGSPALILPLIKRYNALYPRVELNLRLDNYDAIQAALQKKPSRHRYSRWANQARAFALKTVSTAGTGTCRQQETPAG